MNGIAGKSHEDENIILKSKQLFKISGLLSRHEIYISLQVEP